MAILIGHSANKPIYLDEQELVTGRTCIIAQSGAGKSWLVAVLCEQLCKNRIGFCIIDTEGEYFSLKEKFDLVWVGSDEHSDINIESLLESEGVSEFSRQAIDSGLAIIFDVSELLNPRKAVAELASALFAAATELRKPYLLIIEEADKFIPQSKESLKELEEVAKRGRKRGLGILLATQRPSLVNKNILSQCNNQIIGKLTIENDLKAVSLFFSSRKELEDLPKLTPGEFFIMGFGMQKTKIKSAPRETSHKGATPSLKQLQKTKSTKSKEFISEFVKELKEEKEAKSEKISGLAIKTKISEDAAKAIVEKIRKKHFLFRPEEKLDRLRKINYPLLFVKIKTKEGLLLKKIKECSFILDGVTGEFVEIPLKKSEGFSKILDFEENELKILLVLKKRKSATVSELAEAAKISEEVVRKAIGSLKNKKAITESGKKEGANLWISLVEFKVPNIRKTIGEKFEFEKPDGTKIKPKICEEKIRALIKALEPPSEIVQFDEICYPIWEAVLRNSKSRIVWIDALNGKLVKNE